MKTIKEKIGLANKIGASAYSKGMNNFKIKKTSTLLKDVIKDMSFIYDGSVFIGNPDLILRKYAQENPSKSLYVWMVDLGLRVD